MLQDRSAARPESGCARAFSGRAERTVSSEITFSDSRRAFLRCGWSLGAGLLVPSALTGCGGGESGHAWPAETFLQPQTLASLNGELDVTLTYAYTRTTLYDQQATLRSINGGIPAPTLRVNAGDRLRIRIVNQLPANPPSAEPTKHLRYPNSTNLHVHGVHTDPGLVAPGVYGDYVVDDPMLGVQPGETRQHEYRIAADHPPGAYWYHPHLHGATAIQVGSGMAGALMIAGAIDQVPEIAAAAERIFVLQAPIVDGGGALESFSQVTDLATTEPPFLVNGVRRPRLVLRRGEVQRWHFINAAIFKFANLALDAHVLNLYGLDGNPRPSLLPIGPFAPQASDDPTGLVLAPGNRASVLVKAGDPGTYYLRTLRFSVGIEEAVLDEDILAEMVVIEEPRTMALPTAPLPVPSSLAPITDEEVANAGGLKRSIVMRAVFAQATANQPPGSVVHPGSEVADWFYQTDATALANRVFALGAAGAQASAAPAMPAEFIPYQSARAVRQTVALGSVEEWTVFNMNNIRHPFHIHINPIQVIRINGQPIEPFWCDTIALPPGGSPEAPTSITFRTRFRDFAGTFVMHCHMLAHEDMGMMQRIEIA
jgi:FtsP/CotA-like multicopper oxidase with cupredoxin domain